MEEPRYKKVEPKRKRRRLNYKRIAILFIVVLLFIFFLYSNINKDHEENTLLTSADEMEETKQEEKQTKIKMTVVGDIMCHNTQFQDAYNSSTDTYDFSHVFREIKEHFEEADLVIGNLETTFAGKDRGYSGYPTFNTPEALGQNLKALGFDILSTANNHSLDKGYSGVVSTLEKLEELGINTTGTYKSEEESEQILIKEVNDIKLAFLSYTYGTNGIPVPSGKEYCINLIDKELIKIDIEKAKAQGADVICVNMHWGLEYKLKPNDTQKELADFLFENGVDIIFGSHPHVLQPMEKKQITTIDGQEKEVFVIYSLGNFISGQVAENTELSVILDIEVTKRGDKVAISDVSYTPIYMYNKGTGKTERFQVLDIKKAITQYENKSNSMITSTLYTKLTAGLTKITNIVEGK